LPLIEVSPCMPATADADQPRRADDQDHSRSGDRQR
jgi:hypothetical protein